MQTIIYFNVAPYSGHYSHGKYYAPPIAPSCLSPIPQQKKIAEPEVLEVLDQQEENKLTDDLKLIELYENEPALWVIQSKEYMDRNERKRSLDRIGASLKVGVDKVQKKINNMRTYYKKEVNKVEESKRSGAGLTDIYESKWPMYGHLDKFLRPQVKKRKSKSNISVDLDDSLQDDDLDASPISKPTRQQKKKCEKKMEDHLLQKAIDTLDAPKEETEDVIFGKYVGKTLSAMENMRAKMILKSKINNAIFETQMQFLQDGHPNPSSVNPPQNNICQFPQPFNYFPCNDMAASNILTPVFNTQIN